jgi:hypothetical protein
MVLIKTMTIWSGLAWFNSWSDTASLLSIHLCKSQQHGWLVIQFLA